MSAPKPALTFNADFPIAGTADLGPTFRGPSYTSMVGSQQQQQAGFVADPGKFTTIIDNGPLTAGAFDPTTSGGLGTDLEPGIRVHGVYTWPLAGGTDYPFFDGQVDEWPQEYPNNGIDQIVPFACTDAVGLFARAQLAIGRPVERTGSRIAAVAAAAGWTGATQIAVGDAIVPQLVYGQQSAWPHMQACAQAEWGELYVDPDPAIGLVFRSRDQIASDARSIAPQAIYTDQAAPPSGSFTYADVKRTTLPLCNDCTISYDNRGVEVNAQDAVSIGKPRGVRSVKLTLPLHTQSQAQQYANWMVRRFTDPIYSFSQVTFAVGEELQADPAVLFPELLSRKLGDMVTVTRTPRYPAGRAPVAANCWIRGIQHVVQKDVWTSTTFWLQDASWITGLFHVGVDHMDSGSGSTHVLSM